MHLCRCTRRRTAHWPRSCPRPHAGCPPGSPAGSTWPGRPRSGASRPCTKSALHRRQRPARMLSRPQGTRTASGSCDCPFPPTNPEQQRGAQRHGTEAEDLLEHMPDDAQALSSTPPCAAVLQSPDCGSIWRNSPWAIKICEAALPWRVSTIAHTMAACCTCIEIAQSLPYCTCRARKRWRCPAVATGRSHR